MNRSDGSIEQPSGSVQIVNVCSKNKNRRLEGAVFTLYKYNQNTCSFTIAITNLVTSSNGILFIDNVLPGKYKLVETKAPKGYYLCKSIAAYFHICLEDNGKINELEPIYIYNLPLGSIKIDSMKHTLRLEGAVFDLYVYEQKKRDFALVQTNLTTDKNGSLIISNLEPGHYKLMEIKAPPGYELSNNTDTTFLISIEDKGDSVMKCIYITNSLQQKNQLDQSIHLNIIDEENPEVTLEGAVFNLFKKNPESKEYEKVKSNLTTNSHGNLKISNLHSGNYMLVETKPPIGYVLDTNKIYLRLGYTADNKKIDHGTIIIRKHKLTKTYSPVWCKYCFTSKVKKNQGCKHKHCPCFTLRNYNSNPKFIPYKRYKLIYTCQSRCYYKKRKGKHKSTFSKSITCKYGYKYKKL